MDVQEILSRLERSEGEFPKAALQEAVAHREDIIPPLLEVLETVARDPVQFTSDGQRVIHIYAMYLLAQFREPRAYPLLVQIFSAPGELAFDLAGDIVTDDLGKILASVSDGDMSGMTALVENEQANEFVRSAALDGLATLVACGRRSRDEVMAYLRGLFGKLERTPSVAWDELAAVCADLCPAEVEEDLRQTYEEGLIDPRHIAWEEIPEASAEGPEVALERVKKRYTLIEDVVEEMGRWASPKDEEGFEEEEEDSFDPLFEDLEVQEPYRRSQPKIGRNQPCPCGSGKKFKKCCGRSFSASH
jgi:Protein of unknown function (DUF1186)/SEC-C motif